MNDAVTMATLEKSSRIIIALPGIEQIVSMIATESPKRKNPVENRPKYDWFKFWVWFFCGALFGAVLGVRAWGQSSVAMEPSIRPGIHIILIWALFVGFIAGCLSNSGCDER
jgi:hypothetical protein